MRSPAAAAFAALLLAGGLAGCARERAAPEPEPGPAIAIVFEDRPAPEVFAFAGDFAAAPEAEPTGLWAAVPGLARAERGLISRPGGEGGVVVALFRATGGARLSPGAAAALGLPVPGSARLEVVAIRSVPRIEVPGVEAAGVEVPGVEVPRIDAPGIEAAGVGAPGIEAPAVEAAALAAPPVAAPGPARRF